MKNGKFEFQSFFTYQNADLGEISLKFNLTFA